MIRQLRFHLKTTMKILHLFRSSAEQNLLVDQAGKFGSTFRALFSKISKESWLPTSHKENFAISDQSVVIHVVTLSAMGYLAVIIP